jgi:hypothetical protein
MQNHNTTYNSFQSSINPGCQFIPGWDQNMAHSKRNKIYLVSLRLEDV